MKALYHQKSVITVFLFAFLQVAKIRGSSVTISYPDASVDWIAGSTFHLNYTASDFEDTYNSGIFFFLFKDSEAVAYIDQVLIPGDSAGSIEVENLLTSTTARNGDDYEVRAYNTYLSDDFDSTLYGSSDAFTISGGSNSANYDTVEEDIEEFVINEPDSDSLTSYDVSTDNGLLLRFGWEDFSEEYTTYLYIYLFDNCDLIGFLGQTDTLSTAYNQAYGTFDLLDILGVETLQNSDYYHIRIYNAYVTNCYGSGAYLMDASSYFSVVNGCDDCREEPTEPPTSDEDDETSTEESSSEAIEQVSSGSTIQVRQGGLRLFVSALLIFFFYCA